MVLVNRPLWSHSLALESMVPQYGVWPGNRTSVVLQLVSVLDVEVDAVEPLDTLDEVLGVEVELVRVLDVDSVELLVVLSVLDVLTVESVDRDVEMVLVLELEAVLPLDVVDLITVLLLDLIFSPSRPETHVVSRP